MYVYFQQRLFCYELASLRELLCIDLALRSEMHILRFQKELRLLAVVQDQYEKQIVQLSASGERFQDTLPFDSAHSTLVVADGRVLVVGLFNGYVQLTDMLGPWGAE